MTPQEAAEIVITCTATGLSGLPLWEYLPGMLVVKDAQGRSYRVTDTDRIACSVYVIDTDFGHGPCEWLDAADLRPDFTDALTVQALYLLVRRAYSEADGLIDLREWGDGTIRLRISGTVYEGPDYAVFARALAKAPVKP